MTIPVRTRKTFSYTNHTIMSEALEKWDYDLFRSVVPELADIISRINEVQNSELKARGVSQEQIDRMQIATGGQIHMARLAVFASTYVNGVAQIHSDILRHDLFKDWYSVTPDKFQNKTNGITQRRWLGLCNRELSEFITERIGAALMILAAAATLKASTEGYVMLSVFSPGQIPIAATSLNGVRLNALYGECQNLNGVDVGVFGRVRENVNGLQVSAVSSVGTDVVGAQLGLVNVVEADFVGFQLALWNDVGATAKGFQLGLVNRANMLEGLQIGLLNFIDEPQQTCRCLPIVNLGW